LASFQDLLLRPEPLSNGHGNYSSGDLLN